MRKLIFGLAFGFLGTAASFPSSAFSAQSFLGITFGEPLIVAGCVGYVNDKICTFKKDNVYQYQQSWEGTSIDLFLPDNVELKDVLKNGSISVHISDGDIVEGIVFPTRGQKVQEDVLSLLRQKYGKPSSLNKKVMRNTFDTKYPVLSASWKLSDLVVEFKGVESDDLGWGVVKIYTKKFKKLLDDKRKLEESKKIRM